MPSSAIDNFTDHTGVHCTVGVWARLVEGSLTLTEGFLQKDSYERSLTEGVLEDVTSKCTTGSSATGTRPRQVSATPCGSGCGMGTSNEDDVQHAHAAVQQWQVSMTPPPCLLHGPL